MTMVGFDITFVDSGREPQCKPDPKFPEGRHIVLGDPKTQKMCARNIPYPAPRCGFYAIRCLECGCTVMLSVAGRPDDPRIVSVPCKPARTTAAPTPSKDLFR
jgi:hypothetical protein